MGERHSNVPLANAPLQDWLVSLEADGTVRMWRLKGHLGERRARALPVVTMWHKLESIPMKLPAVAQMFSVSNITTADWIGGPMKVFLYITLPDGSVRSKHHSTSLLLILLLLLLLLLFIV